MHDKIGKYEIIDKAGEGQFAEVFKASDPSEGKDFAIKVLNEFWSKDEEITERFKREAGILWKIDHPNVVKVYDQGEVDNRPFYVMEYVPFSLAEYLGDVGESAEKTRRMRKKELLSIEELMSITGQILKGLGAIHKARVIHRDICPQNLLLRKTEPDHSSFPYTVILSDFGISKKSGSKFTRTGMGAMGREIYSAPEQLEDFRSVDVRADIFSVGVLMYYMATTKPPMGRFPEPMVLNEELPAEINTFIMKSLSYEREGRFQGVKEMARLLDQIVIERPWDKEKKYKDLIDESKDAFSRKHFDKATKVCREALKIFPRTEARELLTSIDKKERQEEEKRIQRLREAELRKQKLATEAKWAAIIGVIFIGIILEYHSIGPIFEYSIGLWGKFWDFFKGLLDIASLLSLLFDIFSSTAIFSLFLIPFVWVPLALILLILSLILPIITFVVAFFAINGAIPAFFIFLGYVIYEKTKA